ncbi:MAG: peptidoglycan DD-metalloendopeptidase family protein [Firmicutes bacterium]|nr:peptidoglycan DD-metalloendopeptidase family protein [Bacillota bacterium]
MNRKILPLVFSVLFAFNAISPAYAAKSINDLKNDLSSNQKKVENTKKAIKSKQSEKNDQTEKKNQLDIEISGLQDDIDEVQSVINEKNAEINQKNGEIAELNTSIKKTDKQLKKRMKVMYENGTSSYLELIFQAKGLSDMFTRISIVEDILKHDKGMINKYQSQIEKLTAAKQMVENEKNEQLEAKQILQQKQSQMKTKKAEKEQIIQSLSSDIEALKKQEEEAEKAEKQIQAQIKAAMQKPAQKAVKYTGNGKFLWPLASYSSISSEYGYRIHPITKTKKLHAGIDIAAPAGTAIYAAEDGVVLTSGWNSGYGYCVTINHGGGYVTLYGHCSSLLVSAGQSVKKGQIIAKVGSTGNSTGNHLHFEVKVNGAAVNPRGYL